VADAIREVRGYGKIPGFYPTPPAVANTVLALVPDPGEGAWVLEPSCGMGDLALAAMERWSGVRLDGVEFRSSLAEVARLRLSPYGERAVVYNDDFLDHAYGERYQRIVMNPPFEGYADADHIRRAYDLLAPGGYLVAIASAVYTQGMHGRQKVRDFIRWLDDHDARAEPLPEGAFKESGTGTRTCAYVLRREG
jgi:predicted RNA methylase